MKPRPKLRWVIVGSCFVILLIFAPIFLLAFSLVSPGIITICPIERGVIISALEPSGYRGNPLLPGRHFVWPFVENVMLYSTDRQTYSSVPAQRCNCDLDKIKAAEIHTKDSSDLLIDFQVIYAIDPNQVVQVHRDWQGFYKDHFVGPVTKMITQEVASNYSAEEIDVTKQGELEKQIGERLSSEFSKKGFILDSYRIESVRLK